MKPTKKFHAFDDKPPITFRPGTSDETIIQSILVEKKEYAFPTFKPTRIFDIGANIGVVTVILANLYPEAKIYAFEPVRENWELLKENIKPYDNVIPFRWALAAEEGERRIFPSEDPANLGGFSTHIENGLGVHIPTYSIRQVCQDFGGPDLIKIDVEGAEFEILSAMPGLDKVKWIAGELHGIDDYLLLDLLSKNFHIQTQRMFGDKCWHFHALSKAWTDFGLDPSPQK